MCNAQAVAANNVVKKIKFTKLAKRFAKTSFMYDSIFKEKVNDKECFEEHIEVLLIEHLKLIF